MIPRWQLPCPQPGYLYGCEMKTQQKLHTKLQLTILQNQLPAFCWNTIFLTQDDAGKEAEFRVTPVYSDSKPKGSFYYGTYREIEPAQFI